MPVNKNLVTLIFLGIIPIIIGSYFNMTLLFLASYNGLLIVFFIIDYIITPGPNSIEVKRICDRKFSLGVDNSVILSVRNKSKYILNVEMIDDVPLYFKYRNEVVNVRVFPFNESSGEYFVFPLKRGEYTFNTVHARYNGLLKLCIKNKICELKEKYKVYPNIKDLRKYTLAAIKKNQLIHGSKKTRNFGIGTEFENLREYNIDDEYRKINWMATARLNKLIVNTYEPERNQQIFILIDSSRVMNSEINNVKKLDYAINSAFVLSEFIIKKNDNVGLLVFDSSVRRFVKPGKGMNQFRVLAENLYNVEENIVSADYRRALTYLNSYHKRRSLLCIFTDLFDTEDASSLVNSLKTISKRHVPLVISIKDMRLYKIASDVAKDENNMFLKAGAMKIIDEREKIKKIFLNSGIASIDIPPDELSIEVLNMYISMKATMKI